MDTSIMLSEWKGKLPKGKMGQSSLAELGNRLNALDDNQRNNVYFKVQDETLKSPMLVGVCNLCFGHFGVARFMIKDWLLGCVRLALTILLAIIANAIEPNEVNSNEILKANLMGLVAIQVIWWLVDLVLVDKKLRIQNLRKILQSIDSVKK